MAKELLSDEESRSKIQNSIRIDKDKIEKATEIRNRIDNLTNEIVSLRFRVSEASKIMGKSLFFDNTETAKISHQLKERQVTDQDSLHLFIDDLHKYFIQSAEWGDMHRNPHVSTCLNIIASYRNSFNHIIDMKGGGRGTESAYKELRTINEELLGHKVIKIEEFPFLQIEILERVKKMLSIVEENIEDWLK